MKRKTALYGLLVALAFMFSYVEMLVPIPVGIPGIKLGLANGVSLTALYLLGTPAAFAVGILRVLLAGLLFGTPVSMLYSLCGGLLSLSVMWLCCRSDGFSIIGVSVAGGVAHNVGQIALAAVLLATPSVAWYLPVLLITGTLTGALIGILCRTLLPRLKKLR